MVTGRLGLWNGTPEIQPRVFKSVYDAISTCLDRMDDAIVVQNCSKIEVQGLHHDGRNCFEVHILNEKGIEANEKNEISSDKIIDLSRRCYHKTLTDYIW